MIDYEAATKELTEWLAEQEGITDIADAARSVVDAALGGEALFRKATASEQHTYDHEVDGPYVQVWPEVALPSADDVYGILSDD